MPDVRMPDGTIIKNVPEGTTKAQLMAKLGMTAPETAPDPTEGMSGVGRALGAQLEAQRGAGEVAASLASSILATPISGLAGIGAGLIPGGMTGPEAVERVGSALTFSPRSQAGQQMLGALSAPLNKLENVASDVSGALGKEDPLASTLWKTAILGLPAVAGLRGTRAVARPDVPEVRPAPRPEIRPEPRQIPTIEELRAQANAAFTRAENAGVFINKNAYSQFVDDLRNTLADEGIDAGLHPAAMRAFQRIAQDEGQNLTLKGAEIIRRNINDAASSMNPADQRMALIMRERLDNFMENLGTDDLIGDANATGAVGALREGRELWSRMRKAEEISELVEKARNSAPNFSASGLENALRTQFRQLANNSRRMRRYTAEERVAIRQIARGTPGANALRFIGRYAPTGPVSTAIAAGIGASVGGPLGAAVFGSAGALGRLGASRLTQRNVTRLDELVRGGE